MADIKALTGLERKPTQVRNWMHKAGMRYRKTAQIPSKADPAKQEQWIETILNPLMNVIGAVDAMSKKISFITHTQTLNAQAIMDFLRYLRTQYLDLPIFIFS